MAAESQTLSQDLRRRFATWLSLFYGTTFGLGGTYLPFFPVWLKAVGIDPSWIGTIVAAPAVTRFTVLPFITGLAERRQAVRGAMILTAFATATGFTVTGTQHQPLLVFLCFVATACVWTPMVPLTDAYALRGVRSYGLSYGPLRLWGSVAFILGALACGLLVEFIAAKHLIWVIAGMAGIGALTGLGLRPLVQTRVPVTEAHHSGALLRDRGFLGIILASALIQGSHAAYYGFGSITWQAAGLSGLTIAALWAIGVVAEIVVFALSPRFTLSPAIMVVIGCAERRCALDADRAGAAAGDARSPADLALPDLRPDPGRDHEPARPAGARSHDGTRSGLSRRLQRHGLHGSVDPVRHGLCALRAGGLLPDGRDGFPGWRRHVAGPQETQSSAQSAVSGG